MNLKAWFMEIMWSILFFSICCAICVSCLAKAYSITQEDKARTEAITRLTSLAEVIKSGGETTCRAYEQLGDYQVTFDGGVADIVFSKEDRMETADLQYQNEEGKVLYKLTVKYYKKEGAAQ